MASNDVESEKDEEEKPVVKNDAKWERITAGKSLELTSQMFMGIYSGVEADWDQTKQLLSRITGVDVDESIDFKNPGNPKSLFRFSVTLDQ